MVRAPTRLEILAKIEKYLENNMVSDALKYVKEVKNIVVKELEQRRRKEPYLTRARCLEICAEEIEDDNTRKELREKAEQYRKLVREAVTT